MQCGTIWITGLSASGKTTLGRHLVRELRQRGGTAVELIDGEEIRPTLDRVYGYSRQERSLVVLAVAKLARQYNEEGKAVVVCAISHVEETRRQIRQYLGRFMEVYLYCPVEVCAQRDYKGNYRKAYSGLYDNFVGVTEPYEKSDSPELILDTANCSIDNCLATLLDRAIAFLHGEKKVSTEER